MTPEQAAKVEERRKAEALRINSASIVQINTFNPNRSYSEERRIAEA